jgi:AcrR family transcriptional regulator
MALARAARQPINTQLQKGPKSTQRERLLAGMVVSANRGGYAGANVSEVIAQASVSRPTFYDYFADRDECFVASIEDVQAQLLDEVQDAIGARAPAEALEAAIEALAAFAMVEPARARFLAKEALAGPDTALDARDRGIAATAQLVERAFARVEEGQQIPDLPIDIVLGAVQRVLASRLRRGERAMGPVRDELLRWVQSYERPAGEHRWRRLALERRIARSPFVPATPLQAPELLGPGRPRIPKEAVAENHRLRIMLATARVVAEQGYTAATVAEIVKLAGVRAHAFYELFADKQEAFSAIYEHGFQQIMVVVASAYFSGKDWPQRVWEMLRAATQSMEVNPTAAHAGFVAAYAVGPGAIQRVEDSRIAFTVFLQEGYRHVPRSMDPSLLALEASIASVFEIVYRRARERASRDTAGLLPHAAYLCLAPFLGPEQTSGFIDGQLGESRKATRRASKPKRPPEPKRQRDTAQIG